MWLIGGAALYFLTRKKDPKTTPEAPSSDVGNQVNDTPSVPNNAPSTVVVAAPITFCYQGKATVVMISHLMWLTKARLWCSPDLTSY